MNPSISASQSQKTASASTPFEQITTLEEQQELRVREACESFAEEEHEAKKTLANSLHFQEEKMREEAREELREYSKSEPAAILKESEEETAKSIQTIERQYGANAPSLAEKMTASVIEFTFLPTR